METKTNKPSVYGTLLLITLLVLGYMGCRSCINEVNEAPPHVQTREERIQAQFDLYGAHKGLKQVIKAAANDPDSYENIETTYNDKGDYLLIKQTYTVKNAFGGRVRHTAYAKSDLDGNIFEIVGQE